MESNKPAYILATSGTTATPKLAVHTPRRLPGLHPRHGELDLRPAAQRRLVGHLRHRLGRRPQLHGLRAAARRLHDAALRRRHRLPGHRHVLPLCAENGVTGVFTSPTAIRVLMRSGAEPARKYDLSASSASSAPARCSTRRPGSGSRRRSSRTASRSSTTCGRPRPAARSSATPTASACCRSSPAPPACPCPASRRRS